MSASENLSAVEGATLPHPCNAVDCAGARLFAHARSLATVVRVDGAIDAANANLVALAVRRISQIPSPLILDLSPLEFLGIAGFRELLVIHDEHRQAQLPCGVVVGSALRRLLEIFADHGLIIVDSVPEALRLIEEGMCERRESLSALAGKSDSRPSSASSAGTGG
ncbi:STAS domain protein [Mycobacterium basiliense]|uniref:STAS domain protein n=1 Tax=Mycobacterium basiliense TaxID=2094119 RepID=A0A447GGQ8_9MYCO|nr:STAS domain-containing protein [Mycobacterium basiliense]VDM89549.1 STAS domain protein [Mycobacterium basiliense]